MRFLGSISTVGRGLVAGGVLALAAVAAQGATYLVWTNGTQQAPYDTWGNAFSNIQQAISYAGASDTILVTNGVYQQAASLFVNTGVTVRSVNGYAVTTIRGNDTVPCVWMSNQSAVVEGFTITRGRCSGAAPIRGAGVIFQTPAGQSSGGMVVNCLITANTAPSYFAGGVYMQGVSTLARCVVSNNYSGTYGAIEVEGGAAVITNCAIVDNRGSGAGGGGISLWAGSTIRNCLIARNSCIGHGGGIAMEAGNSLVENCTIAGNTGSTGGGGGVYQGVGTLRNCIVYGNAVSDLVKVGGTVTYTCTTPAPVGTSNIDANPLLVDAAAGDYRLGAGSPCIGTALSNAWMATAVDLDGLARVQQGSPDMGAYEFNPSAPLVCNFSGTPTNGVGPLTVTFTATVTGGNTNGLTFFWDFQNDGTNDQVGAAAVVSTTYPGRASYSISCLASNAAAETSRSTRTNYIAVEDRAVLLVWTNGTQQAPYDTWATAFSNIQEAVDQSTPYDTVLVTDGVYSVSAAITVSNFISVCSANGPSNTVVRRSGAANHRLFTLLAPGVTVSGFTITNGYPTDAFPSDTFGPDRAHGAGVFMTTNCTVANCVIVGNTCGTVNRYGGGVYALKNGVVSNCVIRGNSTGTWGGGVAFYPGAAGGTLWGCTLAGNTVGAFGGGGGMLYGLCMVRDCVIVSNRCGSSGGGGLYFEGGSYGSTVRNCLIARNSGPGNGGGVCSLDAINVENCTVSGNSAGGTGGGFYSSSAFSATKNSIVYGNTAPSWANGSGGTNSFTCTTPDPGGTSNVVDDPLFLDAPAGNYRLVGASPCIGKAQSNVWMAGALDMDGGPRVRGGTPDMGAYEFGGGVLSCVFTANVTMGFAPLSVGLFGAAIGDLTGIVYLWDLNGDGTADLTGSATTQDFAAGTYSVSLTVTNAAGQSNTYTRASYLKAGPRTNYVARSGSNTATFPYDTWAAASSNISMAVNAGVDGTTTWVSNGTYVLTSMIAISNGITVQSVNGSASVVVNGDGLGPGFYIRHQDAVVAGFTVSNCYVAGIAPFRGGGVVIDKVDGQGAGGTVSDCLILRNSANVYSGGVYCRQGGRLLNCTIRNNTAMYGGVFLEGGNASMESCVVVSNRATAYGAGGAYIYAGNRVANCLIAGNSCVTYGGGVWLSGGGIVESCTIAHNTTADTGGGLYFDSGAGRASNCIVFFNTSGNTAAHGNSSNSVGKMTYCCTTNPVVAGTGNVAADPQFVNALLGDYRLISGSPCYNAGTNLPWMTGASDVARNGRVLAGRVDMGAYEWVSPSGIIFYVR